MIDTIDHQHNLRSRLSECQGKAPHCTIKASSAITGALATRSETRRAVFHVDRVKACCHSGSYYFRQHAITQQRTDAEMARRSMVILGLAQSNPGIKLLKHSRKYDPVEPSTHPAHRTYTPSHTHLWPSSGLPGA